MPIPSELGTDQGIATLCSHDERIFEMACNGAVQMIKNAKLMVEYLIDVE